MEKLEWVDFETQSFLGSYACVWRDICMDRWLSNTPPLSGIWTTRQEAKEAVVLELKTQYMQLLESLPI